MEKDDSALPGQDVGAASASPPIVIPDNEPVAPTKLATKDRPAPSPKTQGKPSVLKFGTLDDAKKATPPSPAPKGGGLGIADVRKRVAEFFHSPDGRNHATVRVNGHDEHFPLDGPDSTRWLRHVHYDATKTPASEAWLTKTAGTLEAIAEFEGGTVTHEVSIRVQRLDDAVYVDLADAERRVLIITAEGYHFLDGPCPVKFCRPAGMKALPAPAAAREGDLSHLKKVFRVKSDADLKLIIGFLLGLYNPRGPRPFLALYGRKGTTKTTAVKAVKALFDPGDVEGFPKDVQDLIIGASRSALPAYDNETTVPKNILAPLGRMCTGQRFRTRRFYTNDGEVSMTLRRSFAVASVAPLMDKDDLASRGIQIEMPPIPWRERMTEAQFEREVANVAPFIIAGLFNVISAGLKNEPNVPTTGWQTRLADFERWVTACEPALGWEPGTFSRLLREQFEETQAENLADDAFYPIFSGYLVNRDDRRWEGTLGHFVRDCIAWGTANGFKVDKVPPLANPRAMSQWLKERGDGLDQAGYEVSRLARDSGRKRERLYAIVAPKPPPSPQERAIVEALARDLGLDDASPGST